VHHLLDVPSQITLAGGLVRGCTEKYNYAAKLFNSKLSKNMIPFKTPPKAGLFTLMFTTLYSISFRITKIMVIPS